MLIRALCKLLISLSTRLGSSMTFPRALFLLHLDSFYFLVLHFLFSIVDLSKSEF